MTFTKGCHGYDVLANLFSKGGIIIGIGADMWISDDKELFKKFESHKEEIERDLGFQMDWNYKENKKASYCRVKMDVTDETSMEMMFDWMMEKAVRIKKVFNKYA